MPLPFLLSDPSVGLHAGDTPTNQAAALNRWFDLANTDHDKAWGTVEPGRYDVSKRFMSRRYARNRGDERSAG